jgi:SPP1 family predicted phage head-tail adaptor
MGVLPAGKLNRRVLIQRKSRQKDAAGQTIDVWLDHARVWANFKTITGSAFSHQEFIAGDVEVGPVTTSVRIRFRTDIETDMRLVYDGKIYDIKAVLPDEDRREYCDLAVVEGVNKG